MYNDFHRVELNYEYLFEMALDKGGAPPSNSLFNVQTLRAFMDAGEQVIDVTEKPDTKVEDLDLSPFEESAKTLGLSEEQTYLVYLWLKVLKKTTF